MADDTIFIDGMRFEKPRQDAPEFVKGKVSVKVDDFIAFAKKHQNDRGWLNIDLLKSRGGKLYFKLNTYGLEVAKENGKADKAYEAM